VSVNAACLSSIRDCVNEQENVAHLLKEEQMGDIL